MEMTDPTDDPTDDAPGPELPPEIVALLADPAMWQSPDVDLADRVVRDVAAEAELGPNGARRTTRTGTRYALLGAAAAVFAVLVAIVGISAVDDSGGRTVSAALIPTGRAGEAGGTLDATASDAGVGIEISAPDLPPCAEGDYYVGWVTTHDGRSVPAGTFSSGGTIELWAGVDLDDVSGFTVTYHDGEGSDGGAIDVGDASVVLKATLSSG
jgi:hypothetical protein